MSGAAAFLMRDWWWPFEDVAVFRVQAVVTLVACGVYWVFRKRWWLAVLMFLLSVPPAVSLLPLYAERSIETPVGAERVRLVLANVRTSNRQYSQLVNYIRKVNPDVVVLLEVNDAWLDALAPLRDQYPHQVRRARDDNFGIAILSRLVPVETNVISLAAGSGPAALIRVRSSDSGPDITIIGAHLFPPVSSFGTIQRDLQAASLARLAAASGQRVAVLVDLNMVDSCSAFERLLSVGKLRDSRLGFGIQATWPVQLPFLLIPIDHVLVGSGIRVLHREVGPCLGSDHFPVQIELAF